MMPLANLFEKQLATQLDKLDLATRAPTKQPSRG